MQILAIIAQVLPALLELMGFAEKYFNSPKSGPDKKAFVLGGVQAVVAGMQTVSTGGQKETWDAVAKVASPLIDAAANLAFPSAGTDTYAGPQ